MKPVNYRAVPGFCNCKCVGLIRNLILTGFKIRQNNFQKKEFKNSIIYFRIRLTHNAGSEIRKSPKKKSLLPLAGIITNKLGYNCRFGLKKPVWE
jgi:hypothetical protein